MQPGTASDEMEWMECLFSLLMIAGDMFSKYENKA